MISNKHAIVCNPIIVKDGQEIAGPIITVNPAAVSYAESCRWKNSFTIVDNEGTLLRFINPNIPDLKIAASLAIWHMWVGEAVR